MRGNVYLHFDSEQDAIAALREAGFDDAELLLPSSFEGVDPAPGIDRNHIVRATTGPTVTDQEVGGSLTSESCSSSTLTSLNVSTLTFLANRAGR